jgi:Zn-dependent protease with chaperone function
MFVKPVSLILVYFITVFNMVFLASPLLVLAIPFIHFQHNALLIEAGLYQQIKFTLFLLCFAVSFLMLVYMVFDFLFGFSVKASLKGCKGYEKIKDYDFLTDLFKQVKTKFGEKSVKLYIKNSDDINAFAVSSFGIKRVVLTRGLIDRFLARCSDPKDFLYALRSVIGHEMSHLINKDFLPAFLIITNQKVTNFVSMILRAILGLAVRFINLIPYCYGSRTLASIMSETYLVLNFIITAFNSFVVYNLYEFLRRFISRSVEYRCDAQSARAFGGHNMAFALSMLGENGYFTLFSTHPKTKTRMKKVAKIKSSDEIIRSGFFDSLANYFSLMFLAVICLYFARQANIDHYLRLYLNNHEVLNYKLRALWQLISRFF